MPLDDLVSVIETLQHRIREHGASLRENETRTRMALIDPLLAALGWHVSDPAVVTPEYNVSGRWADYALLRPETASRPLLWKPRNWENHWRPTGCRCSTTPTRRAWNTPG